MSYIPDLSPNLDAFERLRVSEANTLFDSQQEYGLDGLTTWDLVANSTYGTAQANASVTDGGSSVGPTNTNTRMTPLTSGTTTGNTAVLQSRQYIRYIPGKSQFIAITGVFADSASDTASFVLRSSTSGAPVERDIEQASWNIDTFDGTGPSGITIDFTKTQILIIDAQWLAVGRVRLGFDIDGKLYLAHQYVNANILTVPYTQTFNLPVRCEATTGATETELCAGYYDNNNGVFLKLTKAGQGATMSFICCSVQSEGGEEVRGFPRSASNGITAVSVGTSMTPVLAVRMATTFNSRTNRAHVDFLNYIAFVTGADNVNVAIYDNATVTGGAWTAVPSSAVEVNTTMTGFSGGFVIRSDYVAGGGGGGGGGLGGGSEGMANIRNPFVLSQINALTPRQFELVICAASFSGTANVRAALNWNEQTI